MKKKKKRTVPMLGLGKLLKPQPPCPQCSGTGRHPVTGKRKGCPGCKGRAT